MAAGGREWTEASPSPPGRASSRRPPCEPLTEGVASAGRRPPRSSRGLRKQGPQEWTLSARHPRELGAVGRKGGPARPDRGPDTLGRRSRRASLHAEGDCDRKRHQLSQRQPDRNRKERSRTGALATSLLNASPHVSVSVMIRTHVFCLFNASQKPERFVILAEKQPRGEGSETEHFSQSPFQNPPLAASSPWPLRAEVEEQSEPRRSLRQSLMCLKPRVRFRAEIRL